MRWCLIVVWVFISPVISDVDHLSMYLLVICIFSLVKCLFLSFAHFWSDWPREEGGRFCPAGAGKGSRVGDSSWSSDYGETVHPLTLLSTIVGSVKKPSFCACDLYIMKVDNECYCNRQQYIRRWECGRLVNRVVTEWPEVWNAVLDRLILCFLWR